MERAKKITWLLQKSLQGGKNRSLQILCNQTHHALIAEALTPFKPKHIKTILLSLNAKTRASIFSQLTEKEKILVSSHFDDKDLASLLMHMASDNRVDLMQQFSERHRERLLALVAKAEREEIRRFSAFKEGQAGAMMTSDYVTLKPEWTVEEALENIKKQASDNEVIYYCYVVDEAHNLLGCVTLKEMILAGKTKKIKSIMVHDLIASKTNDDQEIAARKLDKYKLLALPIVDDNNNLVGIITHDDAMKILRQEETEDFEKMMAIGGRHEAGAYLSQSTWSHFRNRAPWVVALAVVGLISGMILHAYEDALSAFIILALYIPMVADTGGNTGSQSGTMVIRALAMGEVSIKDSLPVLLKELKVSILLAIVLGALAFGKVMLLSGHSTIPEGTSLVLIGWVIALALGLQVISATLIGAILPLIAVKIKLDPAVVASPALTTIVDITGLLIFFSVASRLLHF